MKKVLTIALAILICASLAFTAFSAASEFVPSITYKGHPDLVSAEDGKGNDISGCLVIVPVAEAEKLPDEKEELLLKVYEELDSGDMELPYEEVDGIDADKMVIRELLEVYFGCDHNHEPDYTVTFDLGVAADDVLVVMTYVEVEGEEELQWVPAEEVTNNGDGTVTFVVESFCPVAIAIEG